MKDELELHPLDYVVLVFVMLTSAGIGLYHGRKQKTSSEYFLAGRSMHPLPASVSFAVSIISAITFLGTTSLGYFGGMAYLPSLLSRVPAGIFTALVICPVLYDLKISSIFEYLGKRFNSHVRYTAVGIQLVVTFIALGIVVYAPALALNAVTGLSLAGSIVGIGLIATFYSAIGGITAVVWNDFIQGIVMVCGMLIVIMTAVIKTGGIAESASRSRDGDRTTVADFRIDPTIPLTVWSTVVGGFFALVIYGGTNQNQAQRYLTCKDLRSAKLAVILGFAWIAVLESLAVLAGVAIYSYYAGCDPFSSNKIKKSDQILPYFITDVFRDVPGMSGFLLGAVFCAALRSISTAINGMTTVTGADIVRRIWTDIPEFQFTTLMKVVSVCYGISFIIMAFAVASIADLMIKIVQAVVGAIGGSVLGVFLLGVLVPRANSNGALLGMLVGTSLGVWVLVGSLAYPKQSFALPLSTASCPILNGTDNPNDFTTSSIILTTETKWSTMGELSTPADGVAQENQYSILVDGFYAISFLHFGVISTVSTFLVGLSVALIFPSTEPVHPSLLSPVLWWTYKGPESFWFKNVLREDEKKMATIVSVDAEVKNTENEDTKL